MIAFPPGTRVSWFAKMGESGNQRHWVGTVDKISGQSRGIAIPGRLRLRWVHVSSLSVESAAPATGRERGDGE